MKNDIEILHEAIIASQECDEVPEAFPYDFFTIEKNSFNYTTTGEETQNTVIGHIDVPENIHKFLGKIDKNNDIMDGHYGEPDKIYFCSTNIQTSYGVANILLDLIGNLSIKMPGPPPYGNLDPNKQITNEHTIIFIYA